MQKFFALGSLTGDKQRFNELESEKREMDFVVIDGQVFLGDSFGFKNIRHHDAVNNAVGNMITEGGVN